MEERQSLYYSELETPIQTLSLLSNNTHIIRIDYGQYKDLKSHWESWVSRYYGVGSFIKEDNHLMKAKEELSAYFSGNLNSFTFNYSLSGTSFQKQVWDALLKEISYGDTKTYKDIAKLIHNPKAIRAVGGAVNKNPLAIVVPCHRVVGTNGKLVGYNGGLDKKEYLLNHEVKLK